MHERTESAIEVPEIIAQELAHRDDAEVARLLSTLDRNAWNRQAAAVELGISRTTLWRKMHRYGLG
jgi:transcriptional regulator of acetoin/glycerol metabolism